MYTLFFNDKAFEKFALEDLLKRGKQTIQAIRADPEYDLDDLTVTNYGEEITA